MKQSTMKVHRRILDEMLSIPTAPFAEHRVLAYIRRFCRERSIASLSKDAAGNLLVRVRKGGAKIARPICLTAHLDHPGFVAAGKTRSGLMRANWRGGVPKEYFVGAKVRFFVDPRWVPGRIRSVTLRTCAGRRRVDTAMIEVRSDVPVGSVGMWDFPDPFVRGTHIHARGCDDIAGASALLCCIETLARDRKPCDAYFLFTRAEEVGFVGAIAAARLGTVPKKCWVVSMETSSERPNARLGDGPILRVGDKTSTFTHAATAHCQRVAESIASRDKSFQYQRRLMDGGTCESSAFCALGYEATGLCVALGNYHNVDAKRKRLAPEFIDLDDYHNMIKWFVALAQGRIGYSSRGEEFLKQLSETERFYQPLLDQTVEG